MDSLDRMVDLNLMKPSLERSIEMHLRIRWEEKMALCELFYDYI